MLNEELLLELERKISAGELSGAEVLARLGKMENPGVVPVAELEKKPKFFSLTKMLYLLGAAVALLGILFFVAQVWDDLGGLGRMAITLGLGLLNAGIGSILLAEKPEDTIGSIFHAIGGVLMPIGARVFIYEFRFFLDSLWYYAIAFAIISGFYFALDRVYKKTILTFFSIVNLTAFVYLLSGAVLEGLTKPSVDFYEYVTLAVGALYVFLAYEMRKVFHRYLFRFLSFVGTFGFLMAGFILATNSLLWLLLYFMLLGLGLAVALYLRSGIILFLSVLFLVFHLMFTTIEYFVDSMGWPIALVGLGFVIIVLGYFSVEINKKYIKGSVGPQ